MSLDGRRIAIIGAGIGGLTAALCMAKRGAEVTIHERADALTEVGAGVQIGPNGVHVLNALGLTHRLLPQAGRPAAIRLVDGLSDHTVATVPMGPRAEARHGAPYLQLHRADLVSVLADAAISAGIEFKFGTEITANMPLPSADAVIAADGIRSEARKRLVPDAKPGFTGQVAWRALIPASDLDASVTGQTDTRVWMGPGQHLVAYPLRGGRLWNIVAVTERNDWTGEGWNHVDDPDLLRAAFRDWCDPVRALLAPVEHVILWGLFSHPRLPRWHDGHATLLGDACHPMVPFLAQGATMAIEDAWVLAHHLDTAAGVPDAFAAYEAERAPRTARVVQAAARNARVYHLANPLLRFGLHSGLRLVSLLAGQRLLAGFDWLYGENVTARADG